MPTSFLIKNDQIMNHFILPFKKDHLNPTLFKETTGLDYIPTLKLDLGDVHTFYHPINQSIISIIGLGEEKDIPKISNSFRSYIQKNKSSELKEYQIISGHVDDQRLLEVIVGVKLGLYDLGVYKTNGEKTLEPSIIVEDSLDRVDLFQKGEQIAISVLSTVKLVDLPSNVKTPKYIADFAQKMSDENGIRCTVYDKNELEKMGMYALLAVGQGSVHPPYLAVMEYVPENSNESTKHISLVGKGISFDTGGISIKPSANMSYMKSDMAGAAAVIGAMVLAAKIKIDCKVTGVIPLAENGVDGTSYRPGDIIQSYSGKSIEVLDTDAEGRLILADGLSFTIKNHKPDYVIDLATLTGSCVATLGYFASGLFTHNDDLAIALEKAGQKVNERTWRLPMWDDYAPYMHSDMADIKNLSSRPVAGAITAAKFLEFFVEKHPNWVHLDIAGVSFGDTDYSKLRCATGYGVRLLVEWMQGIVQNP